MIHSLKEIKIVTGWGNPGGSTIAHVNLARLFQESGYNCKVYSPHSWLKDNYKDVGLMLGDLTSKKSDIFILHAINLADLNQKYFYSCHETNVFPIKNVSKKKLKGIHFVSKFQEQWHWDNKDYHYGVPTFVIPNVVSKIKIQKDSKKENIAGVIGSIDRHKRTHISIQRALADGRDIVLVFGAITDVEYFYNDVVPLLDGKNVFMIGQSTQEQMYSEIGCVYHSSLRETFNFVKHECHLLCIPYFGLEENDPKSCIMDYESILNQWKHFLQLP